MGDQEYAVVIALGVAPEQAVEAVREVFAAAGFGILYQIDMRQAFRDKLQKEFRFYTILGVCDPQLAHRGLEIHPDMGLVIPCNVVVQELERRGTVVKAIRASRSWDLLGSRDLVAVGEQAEARVREALDRVTQRAQA